MKKVQIELDVFQPQKEGFSIVLLPVITFYKEIFKRETDYEIHIGWIFWFIKISWEKTNTSNFEKDK